MAARDTHPDVFARQVELVRGAGVARRFETVPSPTRSVAALSRRWRRSSTGSVASSIYGMARATMAIDLVADSP